MTDYLVGWDEIASYLKVSVVTAWRYEKVGGMPVIRVYTGKVRASKAEIREWMVKTDLHLRAVKDNER